MTDIEQRLRESLADRYAIEGLAGEGGMACVYRAVDKKHGRTVAIKVLRPSLGASLGHDRFLAEIRICAGLSHPHILPLHDSGAVDDLLYFVMPFIEGESLRGRLTREKQLALDDALHIARGVAAALAYAHSRGIVHRDIKPENILLCAGEPIVADFGIAKAITGAGPAGSSQTGAGVAVGTPIYMSPEQASGESDLDGRSDIYSLGCVLFEMLAGDPPFAGPTPMAITARKLVDPVPRVSVVRETVPAAVEQLLLRTLAKLPADRFASAGDLAQALSGSALAQLGATALTPSVAAEALTAAPHPHSIAVLPFTNSGDPDDEFFSDGLSEELIHRLGTVKELHVVARTSAFAFKGTAEDVRAIGRRLNVSAVLEGSVRRAGQRLRVTTQLVSVADGYQLWSERYDRLLEDVFAVQDEIARAAVDALKVTLLGSSDRALAGTRDPRALELYLRARHAWNLRTQDSLRGSVAYLEEAIARDPEFALAYAALADSCATLGIYGALPARDVMPRAEQAAEQALALAPGLAEAIAALACVKAVYHWKWDDAAELFRQAIAREPGYATARHWYAANCLLPQGRFSEAREELAGALMHDPLNASINVTLGLAAHFARDDAAAIECHRRAIEIDPGFGMARYFLGQSYAAMGRYPDAIAALRRARELAGSSVEITAALAHAHAVAGQRADAEGLLAELEARARGEYVSPALLAQVRLGLGDGDAALAALESACEERAAHLIWLKVRPVFDPLRHEPRFHRLLERLGLGG